MNIKRAFYAATAAMMLPGLAMAATMEVTMTISPDTGDDVTVNFTCNAGDNLSDSFVLADGESVTFTNNIPADVTADCSVTATAPSGYEDINGSCDDSFTLTDTPEPDAESCVFAFALAPFEFTVNYEMDDSTADVDAGVSYMLECGPLYSGSTNTFYGNFGVPGDDGNDDTYTVGVPYEPSDDKDKVRTVCSVEILNISDSSVDVAGCSGTTIEFLDDEGECTLTASVFFEGIPTLSQYGMAIMALLMLGVGFVGFRRFV